MRAATLPRSVPGTERLLYVDPRKQTFSHHRVGEIASLLAPNDLLVVNDAATMPASLRVVGGELEVRLVQRGKSDREWKAVLFGEGDFRVPTEQRPEPRRVTAGERLDFGAGLEADVLHVDAERRRLVNLRFNLIGAPLWVALYRQARPVQYAYLERELELWHFQNRYVARPWALEMPSAGHCLSWELLLELRARRIAVAQVTHAAGISSTGSTDLDRMLPLAERYEIDASAVEAVRATKERGGRVVAVGTTVVRALEACVAEHSLLLAGQGEARLVIGPGFRPRVVDGVLSGMHEPATSHFALLEAFASRALLQEAISAADRAGYLEHEFGDVALVLPSRAT
jgi:S-adenosylmethionine:tRNA ribosyltransferase-isomerase